MQDTAIYDVYKIAPIYDHHGNENVMPHTMMWCDIKLLFFN